jgi:hypothetical protein
VVEYIKQHLSIELSAALWVRADLSHTGYQAIVNIINKTCDMHRKEFVYLKLQHENDFPKFQSLRNLINRIEEQAKFLGLSLMAFDHGA